MASSDTGIAITDRAMTGAHTTHTARWSPAAAADGNSAWIVSWIPQRLLDRNQAITAMVLAETVSTLDADHARRMLPFINSWAAELGLTGSDAMARVGANQ